MAGIRLSTSTLPPNLESENYFSDTNSDKEEIKGILKNPNPKPKTRRRSKRLSNEIKPEEEIPIIEIEEKNSIDDNKNEI
jgi:hypothetical protein